MDNDNRILLLEQDFKTYKESTNLLLQDIKQCEKELEDRIYQMEMFKQKTDFQYEQIMETLNKLNDTTIPNLSIQIEELKNKPAKRYDQILTAFIGAIIGAIGSYIANILFKK